MKANPFIRYSLVLASFFMVMKLFTQNEIVFDRISVKQGLSQSAIFDIIQDHKGFMWFATHDGLNKYDGYDFTVYKRIPGDSTSISDNIIYAICQSKVNNNIWLGTNDGGLCCYNYENENFISYRFNPFDTLNSLAENSIKNIIEDNNGKLWISYNERGVGCFDPETGKVINYVLNTENPGETGFGDIFLYIDSRNILWACSGRGLFRFDSNAKQFFPVLNDPIDPKSFPTTIFNYIYEDKDYTFWVTTDNGLIKFFPDEDRYILFKHDEKDPYSISSNFVFTPVRDKLGRLWIGTRNGLNLYNDSTNRFYAYKNDPINFTSLSSSNISKLLVDDNDVIWVGTFEAGVNKFDAHPKPFRLYKYSTDIPEFPNKTVRSVYEDKYGILWVGFVNGGFVRIDRSNNSYKHYDIIVGENQNSQQINTITDFCEDYTGEMWIGTWENGLAKVTFKGNGKNREPDSFKLYKRDPHNPYDLSSQSIQFIFEDSKNWLWIGTAEGLDIYDRKNDRFKHFTYDINNPNSLSNYSLQKAITEDKSSNYWIGTWNGLNKVKLKSDFNIMFDTAGPNINDLADFEHFYHDPYNKNSLSDNRITSLCFDKDSSMWLGLFGSGINKIEFLKDGELQFSCFNEQNGLSNNEVYCVFSDEKGNIWCSTNNGICEINTHDDQILQYNESDGLQGKEFFWGAGFKSKIGEIFMGGNNGLNSFFPSKIEDNNKTIPVVFTQFSIFNEKIKPDGTVLKKNISEANEVYLNWSDKVFSIEFAALYYSSPEVIKYKYRLLGFDKEWSTTNYKNRIATYTNLNPGNYEFQVKSTSLNGSWSEKHSSIIINIEPPFWMTWYFRILMAILIIGLVYLIVIIRLRSIKAHNRRLEILVKERTEDLNKNVSALLISNENLEKATIEAKKADKAKSEFLANMSHEIRTPLNGIIGLTNLMLDTSIDEEQEDYLHKLESSSKSLLYIINDILDFSKIEAGKLEIVKSEFAFDEVLKTIYNLFSFPIERKSLEFNFNIDPGIPRFLTGDEYRILQVVTNLVGNSIKFTSDGFIALKADVIEKNDTDLVIEFCVQDSGIGIADEDQAKLFESFTQADSSLTKRFEGTGLGLTIAKNLVELMGGKIWLKSKEGAGSEFYFTLKMEYRDEPLDIKDIKNARLLVVDDNAIDQAYICRILKSWGVESKSVGNGKEALSILTTERFDLMLVDWKMPVMNGLELLKSLHDDNKMIRHILMVNSFARKDLLSDAKAKGIHVDTVIEKPITISEFYAAIKAENKRSYISNASKPASNLKKTYRAILAEDNVFNQLVQKKILEKMGFEIVVANNGKDAIEILKKDAFDIIFMDLHMPILDGYEATRIIRTFNADIPIIALSAAVLPRDKAHAEQVGINEHISKPINFKELESVINKYVDILSD